MMIAYFTIRLLNLLQWLLVFRALVSWFPQVQQSRIGELLYAVTEPMVAPCRSLLSRFSSLRTMPVDFSPLLAFMILLILQSFLSSLMY
ncbi:MAG: YggT family protein [Eubacteriales bacterium]|nr:YggT family protein [Eubacteriales bacterium]